MTTAPAEQAHTDSPATTENGAGSELRLLDALRRLRPGLIVADVEARRTILANDSALEAFGGRSDFDWVEGNLLRAAGSSGAAPSVLSLNDRLVGFSVYGDGPLRLVFCRDVTEKLRKESLAEASELASLFGSVFMAIRHEVGNPLNSAKTALAVLRMNLHSLPAEAVGAGIDRILEELLRVEKLLQLLKAFVPSSPLDPAVVDVQKVFDEVAAATGPDLNGRRVLLSTAVAPGASRVRADETALRHVLLALVSNAAEAAAGLPGAWIALSTTPGARIVRLLVADSGRGMPEAVRRNAFTPLYHSASGRLGLGLATARALLTRMEGTIEIASVEGAGTTVTVTLPSAEAPEASA